MKNKKIKAPKADSQNRFILSIVILLGVAGLGGAVFYFSHDNSVVQQPATVTESSEAFIVPRITEADTVKNVLTIGESKDLKKELNDLVASKKKDGTLAEAGIYFRDLNRGPNIAINEDLKFSPASLLKLPLAIWFYYQASTTPDFLTQEIEFTGPKGVEKVHYRAPESIEVGKIYTYKELIRYMLQYSDNDATAILGQIAGIKNTDTVYTDLGLEPVENYSKYTIDVQSYGGIFRVLYFAAYLNRTSSNAILEAMSKSSFTSGLAAGLPEGVVIAHKFGERPVLEGKTGLVQLHDCGVIYPSNKQNYMLCVMTQGISYEKEADFIAEVSKKVYAKISE